MVVSGGRDAPLWPRYVGVRALCMPDRALMSVEDDVYNAGKPLIQEEWKMNSRDRRSTGREGVADPGSSYSPHPPQDSTVRGPAGPSGIVPLAREGPSCPSRQEDFKMLIKRHKKTLDLLAE